MDAVDLARSGVWLVRDIGTPGKNRPVVGMFILPEWGMTVWLSPGAAPIIFVMLAKRRCPVGNRPVQGDG